MIIYAADDEKFALELLEEAIIEAIPGAEPVCFRESEELLNTAVNTPPDIVFLDIKMPGLNGIQVAEKLNEISKTVKIVFVTGYSEFANRAFDVYASGYLMKPCSAKNIKALMEKISLPNEDKKDIFVKTFGNFDIYYKGNPIIFRSKQAKELLAYLVDRNGAHVSRQEAAAVLFEDDFSRGVQSRLSQLSASLREDLEKAGVKNFFFSERGYHVNLSIAECDLTEYLKGNSKYIYLDEYMEQYSFGEFRKASLSDLKR